MEQQSPIFMTVEEDLGFKFETLVGPPYEFAKHDAEVRRRIAAQRDAESTSTEPGEAAAAPA